MDKTKILIVDDHAIVREGLSAILGFQPDFSVIGEAASGQEAVRRTKELSPDIVIMDLMMPDMDGAEATAEIKLANPDVKVLILTSFGNSASLSHALASGASGAITKNLPKEELFAAIRETAAGHKVISREIEDTLQEDRDQPSLTPRQLEILQSLSRGLTNKDIAKQQSLSMAGVKFHILAIFRKLDVSNRSEAVAIALRKHLLKM